MTTINIATPVIRTHIINNIGMSLMLQHRYDEAAREFQRALAAEVPGGLVPVLDVDEPQPGARPDEQLDGADVQGRGTAAVRSGRLLDERGLGALFQSRCCLQQRRDFFCLAPANPTN